MGFLQVWTQTLPTAPASSLGVRPSAEVAFISPKQNRFIMQGAPLSIRSTAIQLFSVSSNQSIFYDTTIQAVVFRLFIAAYLSVNLLILS